MFQFYLRAEGLALSWVGSGRMIFSLDFSEPDFEGVADRFVRAAEAMRADGWWAGIPGLDRKSIRRRILGEVVGLLRSRRGGRRDRATRGDDPS